MDVDFDGVCDEVDDCPAIANPAQGPFAAAQLAGTVASWPIVEIAPADLDADGDLDLLVVYGWGEARVALLENVGAGTFANRVTLGAWADDIHSLGVADLDGDADLDLVYPHRAYDDWTDDLVWQENLGGLAFSSPLVIADAAGGDYGTLVTGDFDQDGDTDFVCSEEEYFQRRATAYLNDGAAGFEQRDLPLDLPDLAWFATGDLDEDSDLDLVSLADGALETLENLGDGTFGAPEQVLSGAEGRVAVADLDGDLDPDLLLADQSAQWVEQIAWTYDRVQRVPAADVTHHEYWATCVVPFDADGDGDLDLAAACDELRWVENTGSGTFGRTHVIDARLTDVVIAADVDGDGADDLVVGEAGGDVLWYRNGLPVPADTDADGTCDASDRCAGLDDALDTDGDGVPNGCDACLSATDSDGDGVVDDCDRCPGSPDGLDLDADGVPDGCALCPEGDDDGDGVCDSDDVCFGIDATGDPDLDATCADLDACLGDAFTGDSDADDVCDDADLCLGSDWSGDADVDGVCDSDDRCAGANDGDDADSDLVPDACDRCPMFDDANDADADGAPDACDACLGFDDAVDADLDGGPDACDACPTDPTYAGPDGTDTDGDTVADACDRCDNAADPLQDDAFAPGAPMFTTEVDRQVAGAADIDADGTNDIVTVRESALYTYVIGWATHAPDDTFSAEAVIDVYDGSWDPPAVTAADIDGDSVIDLAVADVDGWSWYPAATAPPVFVGQVSTPILVDLDGDLDLDLVHTSLLEVRWFEFAAGAFGAAQVLATLPSYAAALAPADVDGDGDDDLLVAHDAGVALLENTAGALAWVGNAGTAPWQVRQALPVDVDADGDVDLVVDLDDFPDESVGWMENLGGFTFGPVTLVPIPPTSLGYRPTVAGDVDADGDPDLVVSVWENVPLPPYTWPAVLRNDGGAFVRWQDLAAGRATLAPAVLADLDGDGDLDLANGPTGSWHPNGFAPFVDADGDGMCDADEVCGGAPEDADGDGWCALLDCDDADDTRFPGAPERCDGLDDACAGSVPADELDADGDGFAPCDGDCDDTDGARFPGAAEQCDGLDDACAGSVPADEFDADGDGFAPCDGDCDDADGTRFPGDTDVCNGVDDDCDGAVDEDCALPPPVPPATGGRGCATGPTTPAGLALAALALAVARRRRETGGRPFDGEERRASARRRS